MRTHYSLIYSTHNGDDTPKNCHLILYMYICVCVCVCVTYIGVYIIPNVSQKVCQVPVCYFMGNL
jgi:hypothetical protein